MLEPPILTPMYIVIPAKAGTKKPTSNIKFLKSEPFKASGAAAAVIRFYLLFF
jgi:hypothetical protein